MDSEKPLISVLLALHDPNLDWLEKQLVSVKGQSWDNLELCLLDDCSHRPVNDAWLAERLQGQPYRYVRSEVHLGTTDAFARLVEMASGDYIAFCDQDDIWEPEKLSRLMQEYAIAPDTTLSYSTLSVIDQTDTVIAGDIRQIRKHDRFYTGTHLTEQLFVVCGIYGNTILMPAGIARAALPVAEGFSHDHWMSLWAAHCGEVRFVEEPLVRFRMHGDNQSNVYRKLRSKEDYLNLRVRNQRIRCESALKRLGDDPACRMIAEILDWTYMRERYLTGDLRALPGLIRGAHYSPRAALFELFGAPVRVLRMRKDFS